ncbi:hypothetical protein ACFZAV_45710, partial [Streptomyces sp. NPDC008343]|uniref:hypothetical protein n=1 Tax=Streptomyces sp. NPDC008343 TaxID=3364828 RepID=UPI0036E2C7D4
METTTEYGANSIPVRTQTKDIDTGARQVVDNTLTDDGKAIARTVTQAAKNESDELKTVSTSEFEYHGGDLAGEVSKTTLTGDTGAEGGNPGAAVSSTETSIDKDGEGVGRRHSTITAPDGVKAVTVSDLASGSTLSQKSGDLGETVTEYDIKDRPVKATASDGTTTTTSYELGEHGGSVTSHRNSGGLAVRTVTDELGRETSTETNYKPSGNNGQGQILPDGQWRQTSATQFNTSGQQINTTDAAGRQTHTEYDAWSLPSKVTTPDGTVIRSTHDDVAGTTTNQTLPAGTDPNTPTITATETTDDQGNPTKTETTYADNTPG